MDNKIGRLAECIHPLGLSRFAVDPVCRRFVDSYGTYTVDKKDKLLLVTSLRIKYYYSLRRDAGIFFHMRSGKCFFVEFEFVKFL